MLMKTKTLFLLILLPFWGLVGCSNDDDAPPPNPVDLLPPATQTGENTFGCLLDGKAFLPGGGVNPLDCVYQYVDGGYYFSLQGNRRDSNYNLILIGLSTKRLEIQEGAKYTLKKNINGDAYGTFAYNAVFSHTSNIETGELTITKLDFENNIVSGTFWFDVKDDNGVVHEIREGRFDMQYIQ